MSAGRSHVRRDQPRPAAGRSHGPPTRDRVARRRQVLWILGATDMWGGLTPRCLRPVGAVDLPFHPHDVSLLPDGRLMLFDNGNFQARPFDPITPWKESASKATIYVVDGAEGTVSQAWSYSDGRFAPYVSGAAARPNGNVFVTFGGLITPISPGAELEIDNARCFPKDMYAVKCHFELTEVNAAGQVVFAARCNPQPGFSWIAFRSEHMSPAVSAILERKGRARPEARGSAAWLLASAAAALAVAILRERC